MRNQLLSLALLIAGGTPALAEVTIMLDGGGTVVKTRDCSRGDQMTQCQVDSVLTTAEGQVATKSRLRTTTPGTSLTEVILTGPEGNSKTRKRLLTWGD